MLLARLVLWLVAACVALYFGAVQARIWRGLAVGFVLLAIGSLLPLTFLLLFGVAPGVVQALGAVAGIIASLLVTLGIQEYYAFTQTLDERESRFSLGWEVAALGGFLLFLVLAGPDSSVSVLRGLRIMENSSWVFLTLVNLGLIAKICRKLAGTPVNQGLAALAGVCTCIVLWRGSELYLDVYRFEAARFLWSGSSRLISFCSLTGEILAALGISAGLVYLARLLR
jgi:hypothetical protein